ncbi:cytochrome D oxidase subunit I [Nitrospira sp. KM1]|uniref:cytochrome d ubiquinol oxidase subunit II n=1 Tax=Nitrospira sp. KM1 TaxID=1936990 RepID=UPI0013A77DCE|nr:cytochrome d ubiquinol oxidase subunit II [Nitrospira sp. KM1]BCA54565.1 cytochrome D oxidase subunit I [Nitrospira sp. KM1]
METFWYIAVTFMLAMYIVLDGYDFGVGFIYPFVARTESERRAALTAIGPVWTGNEVWLIGAGGTLFFAFPKAYAAGFSGFYLALIIVLWLLIARGLALELRGHLDHPVWRQLWDLALMASSTMLALVFGAALGNLIRGVPLNRDGYFFVALWTDFLTGPNPGILDWFTLLTAATSLAILGMHGASYLAMKTDGELRRRARRMAAAASWVSAAFIALVMAAIALVRPSFHLNYEQHPAGFFFPLAGVCAVAATIFLRKPEQEAAAFSASSALILFMLTGIAWGTYPNILIATTDPSYSLTVTNAIAGSYGLQIGLQWFMVAFPLLVIYQVYLHRLFRGKVGSNSSY